MTFQDAVKSAFKNYAKFDGRATRSEYWWFALFHVLVMLAFVLIGVIFSDNFLGTLAMFLLVVATLGMVIPSLALLFRRLHDTDRSAWWILIELIPFGGIVLLVFLCLESTRGPNKYGPPSGATSVAETFS